MNAEFFEALDALEKTKGIPKKYMMERVEAALTAAFKKERGAENVRVSLDPVKKDVKLYAQQTVVEEVTDPVYEISLEDAHRIAKKYKLGDVVETEVKTKTFGRLAAQTAKQVIIQGIREAERSSQIREFEKRREEVIPVRVTMVMDDTGDVMVETGNGEFLLRHDEMIPGETFTVGDRMKVFVSEVSRDEESSSIVTLSRTHPNMIRRLLEAEVPEIEDGTVIVKGVIREPGSRSKVAVLSRDDAVDPIGACIGERGQRIQQIVDELCGEKIDVVRFSEIPEEYIAAALSPAKVKEVEFDGEHFARVLVDADQLSLAIGKEGQNARLAARLTGYKIDIKGSLGIK